MSWKHVGISREGRIATVRLDRGDGLNALSVDVLKELIDVAQSFEGDLETSAVVLTGTDTYFTAGIDLKDPARHGRQGKAPLGERRNIISLGPKLCRAWEEMEQITFAAIEGFCVGGGSALVSALDFRVMARSAYLRVPELVLGMNMSWQSLPRFTQLIGPARAKQLVLFNEKVFADQAYEWGLAQAVAEDGGAVAQATEMAVKVAAMPPVPVRMVKQTINQAAGALNHAVSYMDRDQFALCQTGDDHKEGVSAFLEKRPPDFKGA